jgi:long-chain acyl-CoA synthetase
MLKRLVADKILARLGGRLGVAISGGAALSPEVARVFIALGVPLYQGYGLTEASPVVSVNTESRNIPSSIGQALPDVDVRIGEQDELLVRADSVMMGYWQNEQATARAIDREGWLHTGDKARIVDDYIYITGRLKDIIVLANGEKVSPADMELAIADDPLFEQVLVIGESRPFLSAIVVVENRQWETFLAERQLQDAAADKSNIEKALIERIAIALKDFPGYAQVYRVCWLKEPWTVEGGLLTPTLKIKRNKILELHAADIEAMYQGHTV